MSIQGDVVKGSQTRRVCLPYFPRREGHCVLKDNTTKMKAEIGTHAPTAFRSRDALGQRQHRNKTWASQGFEVENGTGQTFRKKNYQNISNVIGLDLNDNFQAEQHGTVTEALTNKNLFLTPGHSLIWPKRACAP